MKFRKCWWFFLTLAGCTKHDPLDERALHLTLPARIKSLDPIQGNDLYSITESSYAYEPLLEYHYLKRPYALVPRLVTSMPELAHDHVTYTFRLRDDLRFADDPAFPGRRGRDVTAEDFVYSWRRLADPKNMATGWWVLDGKIAGLNEWRDQASKAGHADYSAPVAGLVAKDAHTLVVRLVRPNPLFLYSLAMLPTAVVAREQVEKYGPEFGQHAAATGPYVLKENMGGTKLVFDANPTFRRALYPAEGMPGDEEAGLLRDAGQPLPRNPRIVTQINEESLPAWLGLLAGKLDLSGVPKDAFASALPGNGELSEELKRKGLRAHRFPNLDLTRVSFNLADPLFARNKLLRQALSLAFDRGPMIRMFYNNQAVPAQGPIPPGIPGSDPEFRNPYFGPDLARAKALLAKAGYPEGKGLPPIEFNAVASATSRQLADYIQQQFAPLGVKLKIDTFSWPEYAKRIAGKKGQMWAFGWIPFLPDGDNFLQLFYGKNAAPGPNDMNYANPEFDALYEKARAEVDQGKRLALYHRLAAIVAEDAPCIFLLHRTDTYLAQSWLRNVKLSNFAPDEAKFWRIENRPGTAGR
jgi:oligopeptide transport system substrate-binding protein